MEIEKKLRVFRLSAEMAASITFDEVITTEAEGDDEAGVVNNSYFVKSPFSPHSDLIDVLKKLRKHALEVCEMPLSTDAKEVGKWIVTSVKISGDLLSKTSRVVMVVSKKVKTGKMISITTPQVTMYPTQEEKVPYQNADKMAMLIEDLNKEVFLYLKGKYEMEGQLPLFADKEAVEA